MPWSIPEPHIDSDGRHWQWAQSDGVVSAKELNSRAGCWSIMVNFFAAIYWFVASLFSSGDQPKV